MHETRALWLLVPSVTIQLYTNQYTVRLSGLTETTVSVAQNLRECVFAQWRAVRARALKHPTNPSRKVVRSTLNARLERAILKDYVHHVNNNLVARWRPLAR